LKYDDCGKTLGYVHDSVKVFPPKGWIRLTAGGPIIKIEKDVFVKNVLRKEKQIRDYSISSRGVFLEKFSRAHSHCCAGSLRKASSIPTFVQKNKNNQSFLADDTASF